MTADYGLQHYTRTPVRAVAHNTHGEPICSECGTAVGESRGPQAVARPDLVDGGLAARVGETLPVYGWRCTDHVEAVVLAFPCDANADRIGQYVDRDAINGWTGVRLRCADQEVRWVAVPRREV